MKSLFPWLRKLKWCVAIAVWLVGGLLGVNRSAAAATAIATAIAKPGTTALSSIAPAALPSTIPFKREPESTYGEANPLPWVAVPLGALALLYIGVRVTRARRHASTAASNEKLHWTSWRRALAGQAHPTEIRRVDSTRLSPHHTLHVVEWQGRRLLVGCSEHSVHLLAEAPGQAPSAAEIPAHDAGSKQVSA